MTLEEMLQIVRQYRSDDLFTHGNIPPKKLQSAKTLYPVDPSDTPVALIDATVFGSAKCGMVIGLKGLYWKNDWTTPSERSFLSWEELSPHANSLSSSFMTVKLAPGCEFNLSGSSMKSDQLIGMLKLLCAASNKQPALEAAAPAASALTPEQPLQEVTAADNPVAVEVKPSSQEPVPSRAPAAPEPTAPTPPKRPRGLLVSRPPDQLYDQIKSFNTVQNVFNFAMAVLADNGKSTDATKAFQSYMVRALGAFRKHVAERRGIPELANDMATMEVLGLAFAIAGMMMLGRRVPDSVMEQVMLEGLRATLNIQGTVQESNGGQIVLRLGVIYSTAADQGSQGITAIFGRRLIGSNITGSIDPDYNLARLLSLEGKDDLLEPLVEKMAPGLVDCQEEITREANLLVSRLLDLFPNRH